jgi:peptidoglycan/LPS O-acetylase OafA/YrhL
VDLFLILSGFLITSIILRSDLSSRFLAIFYLRRSLRIWPIYYVALVGIFALSRLGCLPAKFPDFSAGAFKYYAIFAQELPRYWGGDEGRFRPLDHFWSLAVEEQFYLFWPILLCLLGKKWVLPLSVAFLAGGIYFRDVNGLNRHLLLSRCDGLAYGALLAGIVQSPICRGKSNWKRYLSIAFAAIVLSSSAAAVLYALFIDRYIVYGNTALLFINPFYFGIVGLLVSQTGARCWSFLRGDWICYLGKISYGLYLYHGIVICLVDSSFGLDIDGARTSLFSTCLFVLELGITIVVSILSWEFFESRILAFKDRLSYGVRATRGPTIERPSADERDIAAHGGIAGSPATP